MNESMKELVGSMHIHSTYSDGSLGIPEICGIAIDSALDFILMTDHMTLQPKHDGMDGWHGSLIVIIGFELQDTRNQNHYLVFGYDGEIPSHGDARTYVRRVKENGGIGIIAHPDEEGGYVHDKLEAYPWTEWRAREYNGIELWNQMTEWKEGLTATNKYWRLIHPRRYLRGPKQSTLARWDYLMQQRKVIGTAGPDAHAAWYKLFGCIPVCIYPYKVNFKLIRMHVLLPETVIPLFADRSSESFKKIQYELLMNLAYGRAFISNYYLGDARGFRLFVRTPSGIIGMGDQIEWPNETCYMEIRCPRESTIKILRNGKIYKTTISAEAAVEIVDPGVYRVEVFRKNKYWILSNPIWLQSWPDTTL